MDNINNHIDDSDTVYRIVHVHEKVNRKGEKFDPRRRRYKYNYKTKRLEVTSCAFLDGGYEISVDLARKKGYDPSKSKKYGTDGIVSIIVGYIKKIPVRHYNISVRIKQDISNISNDAHSVIFMILNTGNEVRTSQRNKSFRSLKRELATIANAKGWDIEPIISEDDVACLREQDLQPAYEALYSKE